MKHAKLLLVSIFAVITATSFTGCGNKTEKNTSKTTTTENGVVTTVAPQTTTNITTVPAITAADNQTTPQMSDVVTSSVSAEEIKTSSNTDSSKTTTTKKKTSTQKSALPQKNTKTTTTAKTSETTTKKNNTSINTSLNKNQQAVKSAEEIANFYATVYPNMVKEMLMDDYGYSETQAIYAINHANIDWNLYAKSKLLDFYYMNECAVTKEEVEFYMVVDLGFGSSAIDYAFNNVDIDWNFDSDDYEDEYEPIVISPYYFTSEDFVYISFSAFYGSGSYQNYSILVYVDGQEMYYIENRELAIECPERGLYEVYMYVEDDAGYGNMEEFCFDYY